MIDLHTHILPGLDDGPDTVAASVELARVAVAGGIGTVVATPHIDHRYGIEPERVEEAVHELNLELIRLGVDLRVLAGGEIAPARLPALDRAARGALALGHGPYLLVECPFSQQVDGLEALVLDLLADGQRVLLAHPERCPGFLAEPGRLSPLVDAGALTCLTAGAVRGEFGGRVGRFAAELLGAGLAHCVASDAHDHWRRPPRLDLPAGAGVDADQARRLTDLVPQAILDGRPLPPGPGRDPAHIDPRSLVVSRGRSAHDGVATRRADRGAL